VTGVALAARALFAAAALLPGIAQAETCRFVGETTRGGTLSAATRTSEADGVLTVDVTIEFAISALLSDVRYYGEEISVWRGGVLQSIGVNQRTLVDGSVKRQQWDVFRRAGVRMEAFRVQAKRLAEFQQHHPSFVSHWAVSSFGQPWLQDYRAAPPERRPDLDLPATGAVRTPLALAFYWSRFLPPEGGAATVILPGFKRDMTAALRFGPATSGDGWRLWSSPLVHPGLERTPASLAAAWVSPQEYLLQLGFDVHTEWASGRAILHTEGCKGVQIRPE